MPIDAALVLRAASNIGATATTTAIDVEGGSMADVVFAWDGTSGTSPTNDISLEVSLDGGSNYFSIWKSRQFISTDVPVAPATRFVVRRPVWIPQNTQTDAWAGSARRTKVRIVSTIGGSNTPLFTNYEAYLDLCAAAKNVGYEQL